MPLASTRHLSMDSPGESIGEYSVWTAALSLTQTILCGQRWLQYSLAILETSTSR
jgi:hypothetical protein